MGLVFEKNDLSTNSIPIISVACKNAIQSLDWVICDDGRLFLKKMMKTSPKVELKHVMLYNDCNPNNRFQYKSFQPRALPSFVVNMLDSITLSISEDQIIIATNLVFVVMPWNTF